MCIYTYTCVYEYIHICLYTYMLTHMNLNMHMTSLKNAYGVAIISRLLETIGLFCERAL